MSRRPQTVEQKLDAVLERTGIRAQLEAEIEAERQATHKALAERLAAGEATYVRRRDELAPQIEAAEEATQAARRAVDAALADLLKLLNVRDTNYGTFDSLRIELEPKLREHADPRIDAFKAQLTELLNDVGKGRFSRMWPAPGGGKDWRGGPAMVDNRKECDALQRAILEARDEAERLKLKHYGDLDPEFNRIWAALPAVPQGPQQTEVKP